MTVLEMLASSHAALSTALVTIAELASGTPSKAPAPKASKPTEPKAPKADKPKADKATRTAMRRAELRAKYGAEWFKNPTVVAEKAARKAAFKARMQKAEPVKAVPVKAVKPKASKKASKKVRNAKLAAKVAEAFAATL